MGEDGGGGGWRVGEWGGGANEDAGGSEGTMV